MDMPTTSRVAPAKRIRNRGVVPGKAGRATAKVNTAIGVTRVRMGGKSTAEHRTKTGQADQLGGNSERMPTVGLT